MKKQSGRFMDLRILTDARRLIAPRAPASLSMTVSLVTLLSLAGTLPSPATAAARTVTLVVPGMNCAACPITVRTALGRVAGVQDVSVNYAKREAAVTFDNARTGVPSLTQATANAGYPSSPKP